MIFALIVREKTKVIVVRLIDVDKLIKPTYAEDDNITGSGMSYDEMDGYNDAIDMMWNRIQHAPVIEDMECHIDAQWVEGIKMPDYPRIPYEFNRHYCSACEKPAIAYERDRYNVEEFLTPRCPECGAYMRNGG